MRTVRSVALLILGSLIATVLTLSVATPAAQAGRPPCGDGLGNALGQVRDNMLDHFISMIPFVESHPFEPESLGDFWDRCGDPFLPDPPPPGYSQSLPGGGGGGRGSSSGDPHIVTQDRVRYDFHASGDFTLLETDDGSTNLQIRFRGNGAMTVFDSLAGSVDGVEFSIETFNHSSIAKFYVAGELVELPGDGWYDLGVGFVLHNDNVFNLRLDNEITVLAQRSGLSLATPGALGGTFHGLHGDGDGDPTNDIVTRSGEPIDATNPDELYGAFMNSWAVEPQDSLFSTPSEGPRPPDSFVTLADFEADAIESAVAVCTAAGLQPGQGLDECVFDVALTGDPVWADDVPTAASAPTVLAGLLTPASESIAVQALTTVDDAFENWEPRSYAVAASNVERTLRVQPECQTYGAPVASIVVDGQPASSISLVCDTLIPVPSAAFELRVASPSRLQSDFTFTLGEVERIDLGSIDSGENLVGSLQSGEQASGQLEFDVGTRVFLDTGPLADCAVTMSITDASGGVVLPRRNSCIDHGPLVLDGIAPFTLTLTSDASATYDLTVSTVEDDRTVDTAAGEQVSLQVSTAGQTASAVFDLQVGDRLYFETIESVDGSLTLVNPAGDEVARSISINDLGLVQADASGEYTLSINPKNAAVGTQRVTAHTVADDTTRQVSTGDALNLQVSTPGQAASVTVELDPGERIYVETLASMDGNLTVTAPTGESQQVLALNDVGLVTASTSGQHLITLTGRFAATGTQSLMIHPVADDLVRQANVGDQLDLTIETPGQRVTVMVDLRAGQTITTSNDETISGTLTFSAPDGTVVLNRPSQLDRGTITAGAAGTYSIELRGNDATVGTQTITITEG